MNDLTTREMATELALIRDALELQIELYQLYGRYLSAEEIQRKLHGKERQDGASPYRPPG